MDYYTGALSLRELLTRLRALPHEAPIWRVVEEQHERAAERQKITELEATLAKFKPQP